MADLVYLDCSTGVSGDMLLTALAHGLEECGFPAFEKLRSLPVDLGLSGVKVEIAEKKIAGIRTYHLEVVESEKQPLRFFAEIERIIQDGTLSEEVKSRSMACVRLLADVEAKVHGTTWDKVHFHEVGAVDTVIDIVGTMVLLELINPEKIVSSPIDLGSGFVRMAHGRLPVPPPACAELGKGLLVFGSECGMERATPTGLAVVKSVVDTCGPLPSGTLLAVGYGSGGRSSDEQPTYVRAFLMDAVAVDTRTRESVLGLTGV